MPTSFKCLFPVIRAVNRQDESEINKVKKRHFLYEPMWNILKKGTRFGGILTPERSPDGETGREGEKERATFGRQTGGSR